jgi:hypothetical protein
MTLSALICGAGPSGTHPHEPDRQQQTVLKGLEEKAFSFRAGITYSVKVLIA